MVMVMMMKLLTLRAARQTDRQTERVRVRAAER